MKRSGNRSTIINFNSDPIRIFGSDYFDNTNNEQTDTKNMPDLESEKSGVQENQKGQGLNILTPY